MILTVIVPAAVLGVLVLFGVLAFQRGLDTSPRGLVRVYLYVGSLVSVLVLAFGLSLVAHGALGAVAPEFTYGGPPPGFRAEPRPVPAGTPPPGVVERPVPPSPQEQNERRTRESLLQGLTTATVGALFWGVHWWGRRKLEAADERSLLLRRGYFLVGVATFGIASIALLPFAVYQSLRYFLIPAAPGDFRPGAGEALSSALVAVPAWLLYLRVVLDDVRAAPTAPPAPAAPEAP